MSTTNERIQLAATLDAAIEIGTKASFPWSVPVITRKWNQAHGITVQQPVAAAPAKVKFVPNLRSMGAVEFVLTPHKGGEQVTGLAIVTERESPKARGEAKVVYDLGTPLHGDVQLSHKVYTRALEGASGMTMVKGLGMCHVEIRKA